MPHTHGPGQNMVLTTVLAIRDVKGPPKPLNAFQSSGRIIVEEEDDEHQAGPGPDAMRSMLKLVLADQNESLLVAVEHEQDSVPFPVVVGDKVLLDLSGVVWVNQLAFLKKGALKSI